ncbi:putative aspartic peptidase A1 family, aspartic peptidase domain superfamily [Helianthus annuus]|nr:putative aspartic peptidase A1 family, aspartic peptidase domain superfamily [Helianthus annuus]KAJ0783532.1 putative aspartic peptidase A1 family, aspartic peptidase domain superfamily [Helianthus annuus]
MFITMGVKEHDSYTYEINPYISICILRRWWCTIEINPYICIHRRWWCTIEINPYIYREHYTAYVTGIEVGAEFLNLSNGAVEKRKAVIDSGTSLVYLPKVIYKPLILAVQSGM